MSSPSFYWYDLETSGRDARKDRILQFAGIRTDTDLQPLAEPDVWYLRLAPDVIPDPEAALITGFIPQRLQQLGRSEAFVMEDIHRTLMAPSTCALGWNTLRFDDEFLRHSFFRNLLDPYEREWRGGNSRWDMIDVVRMAYALRPEVMQWPVNAEGKVSFRLEGLAEANGIRHEQAHEALSDVEATIGIARCLKKANPRLWQFAEQHRSRLSIQNILETGQQDPVLHIATRFGIENANTGVILPLLASSVRQHHTLVANLLQDPLDEDLPVPLYWVATHRSPMILPWRVLRKEDIHRLGFSVESIRERMILWQSKPELKALIAKFVGKSFPDLASHPVDSDVSLYSGGFLKDSDRRKLSIVRQSLPSIPESITLEFEDDRLHEMVFRYRARNFPETLDDHERQQWQQWCSAKHRNPDLGMTLEAFQAKLRRLHHEHSHSHDAKEILNALEAWVLQSVY